MAYYPSFQLESSGCLTPNGLKQLLGQCLGNGLRNPLRVNADALAALFIFASVLPFLLLHLRPGRGYDSELHQCDARVRHRVSDCLKAAGKERDTAISCRRTSPSLSTPYGLESFIKPRHANAHLHGQRVLSQLRAHTGGSRPEPKQRTSSVLLLGRVFLFRFNTRACVRRAEPIHGMGFPLDASTRAVSIGKDKVSQGHGDSFPDQS